MVDSIFSKLMSKTARPPGTIARLKVSTPVTAQFSTGLTSAEQKLDDVVTLSADAKNRLRDSRKLDAYLRIFSSVLKVLNGETARYVPQFSRAEVEFVKPEMKSSFRTEA